MTTIAYRDGVIASDSRVTIKEWVDNDTCKKVFKLPDGAYIATAGDYMKGKDLIDAMRQLAKTQEKSFPVKKYKKVSGILVCPNKDLWVYEYGRWEQVEAKYVSCGSGSTAALAAMDAGASAREAVRIGIKRDVYSGGKVQSYKVF